MKKNEPLWYPHYCNTQDNLELMGLMDSYYEAGFAVLFIVKEKLMVSETGALPYDRLVKLLQRNYSWQYPEKLPEIINRCVELGLLDKDKGGNVSCNEIYERRGLVEKGKRDGAKGGDTSASNKAGGYNQYRFKLQDETIWKLPNKTLNKWRGMFQDCDSYLKDLQDRYDKYEYLRDTKDSIEKHLENYLNEFAIPKEATDGARDFR